MDKKGQKKLLEKGQKLQKIIEFCDKELKKMFLAETNLEALKAQAIKYLGDYERLADDDSSFEWYAYTSSKKG